MKQFISNSSFGTKQIATALAEQITKGVIALSGDLGAGKTTFVQGFAKGLGIKEKIISPTFILLRSHKIPYTGKVLYHLDLYRLENEKDFKSLGLKDLFNNPNNLILIEWAEKIEKYLPKNNIKIFIDKKKDNLRLITVS